MRRWAPAAGWSIEPDADGLALTHSGRRMTVRMPPEVGREIVAAVGGLSSARELTSRGGEELAKLDARGVLGLEVVREQHVLARHEPGARRVRHSPPSPYVRPVRALPSAHMRFGPDGPELAGGNSADRVVLTSTWAVEFAARLIARADVEVDSAPESELLDLLSRAGLLVTGRNQHSEEWEFHDSLFHGATRLDTSFGLYGAKIGTTHWEIDNPVRRPMTAERIALGHDDRSQEGMTLQEAISARSSLRDHGGPPIGSAEISAVLDASLRIRRLERTVASERAWRSMPTGGALSGLSAVVIAASAHDLERGAYEYDAVSHELAPASGPAPAIDRWLGLAHRLTGIPHTSIQAMVLFVLDYARPARSYDSIVYATALKEVGAALQAMALVSTDRGLSFCPMGGGFATTAGLGEGIRTGAVIGEAVLGRPKGTERAGE